MKEYPILFNSEMIRAILDGRKTMTRRLNKGWLKVKKGDHLYVKETWFCDDSAAAQDIMNPRLGVYYRATEIHPEIFKWKSSRYMFRWAARIYLEATADAREEWLQDINEEDAVEEGFKAQIPNTKYFHRSARGEFKIAWNSLNPKAAWSSNPEVVVLEFRRIEK